VLPGKPGEKKDCRIIFNPANVLLCVRKYIFLREKNIKLHKIQFVSMFRKTSVKQFSGFPCFFKAIFIFDKLMIDFKFKI